MARTRRPPYRRYIYTLDVIERDDGTIEVLMGGPKDHPFMFIAHSMTEAVCKVELLKQGAFVVPVNQLEGMKWQR